MGRKIRIEYLMPTDQRRVVYCDHAVCFDVARAIARRINDKVSLYGPSGEAVVFPDGAGRAKWPDEKSLTGIFESAFESNVYPCI